MSHCQISLESVGLKKKVKQCFYISYLLRNLNMYIRVYILHKGDIFPCAYLPMEPLLHAILEQLMELFWKFHLASLS